MSIGRYKIGGKKGQNIPEKINNPKDFRNLTPIKSKLSKDVFTIIGDFNYY